MDLHKKKHEINFIIVFLISFIVFIVFTATYIQNKGKMEYAQMEQLVLVKTNKINNVISKLLYKTQILSALVIQSNGTVADFEQVAMTVIDDPAIKNVLLAPDGIVSDVYPREGNESVIGLNYFSEGQGNKEAALAKETGQLVLGGPFNLVQGGMAMVGRLPVYLDGMQGEKHFWGLVSVTLNYPQALDGAELDQLENQGFAYEIWRINPDTGKQQIISHSDYYYNKNARYVEQTVQLFNAEWHFRLSPIRNWYEYPETWFFSIGGFLISILIASLFRNNSDLKLVKLELEELTYKDQLTGILNRRGITKKMEQLIREPGMKFILCYMDLDKFKRINDQYGHNCGDVMLRSFSDILAKRLRQEDLFARIGGDEFITVIRSMKSQEEVKQFFEALKEDFKSVVPVGNNQILDIEFSVGMAVYPESGNNFDALIGYADQNMYEEKAKKSVL